MKKIVFFAAFTAALVITSCNKEVKSDLAPEALKEVRFNALPVETKTAFGEKNGNKYPVLWTEKDTKVGISLNYGGIASADLTPSADGKSASFSGQFAEAESYQFIVINPFPAFKSRSSTNRTVMVEIPSGQTSTATSPDESAQILMATTEPLTELPESIDLTFGHITAYLHLQFSNVALGEATVQSVSISQEDYYIAGRLNYLMDSGQMADTESGMFKTITVSTTTLDDVWCCLRPVDLSGKQLTLIVSTDKGTFTKTVTMPASANLTGGKIGKFNVDMSGISLAAPVTYKLATAANQLNVGDKIIIASAGDEYNVAISTAQNGNNRAATGVSINGTVITDPSDAVEIIELEDGLIPGHYALKATGGANDGYLYAANATSTSSDNLLRTQETIDSKASWDISFGDVTVTAGTYQNCAHILADIPEDGHGLIRFNVSNNLFSAYVKATKQFPVSIYRLDVPADETPRFKASLPGSNKIDEKAQDVQIYIFGNVAWTATASDGTTLDATSGTGNAILTLSVPANTDADNTKTHTVTISTTAAVTPASYELSLTQAKAPKVASFPVIWSMPAEHNVKGEDYDLINPSGSYVYSDAHDGKLTMYRISSSDPCSSNPTYIQRTEERWEGKHALLNYGVYKEDYWLFEVFGVTNPAGTYGIDFWMESSKNGPKYFAVEYSLDGSNWTVVDGQSGSYATANETFTYSFALTTGSGVQAIQHSFHMDAITAPTTLLIRARVVSISRVAGTNMGLNHGATNRIGHHVNITFTAD